MITLLDLLRDVTCSFLVAIGFALIFETPKKALWVAGLLGSGGHVIRFILMSFGGPIIGSTFAGTLFIGFAGVFFAHRIHTPPVVFTLPACITMIPGLYAYRTMLGGIKIYQAGHDAASSMLIQQTIYNFILTFGMLFCLGIGICIAALLSRKRSTKNIYFFTKKIRKP